jgi:hypothetical protein
MWKRLRCMLGHDWHTESTEDGSRYLLCRRCGKYEFPERPHWAAIGT